MNADSHSFALLASSDGRSWVNVAAWIGAGVFAYGHTLYRCYSTPVSRPATESHAQGEEQR